MTGLGEELPDPTDSSNAVEEMIERAAKDIAGRFDSYEWDMRPDFHSPHSGEPMPKEAFIDMAHAALLSLGTPLLMLAALQRGEWVAVPKNPTKDMISAFGDAIQFWLDENGTDADVYISMITAAPKSPDEAQ